MNTLWTIAANPRKRRASGRRKTRSAAQRAATARMLAANRARRNPRKRSASKRRASPSRAVARRSSPLRMRTRARRVARRASMSMRGIGGGALNLVKAGALGAGGALVVDVAMAQVNGFLPASMNTKLNTDGTPNYANYAVKGVLAIALAHFGKKVVSAETVNRMATGSFTVMAYEIARPMVSSMLPASMSLGWFSPGMTFKPGITPGMGIGQYQNLARLGQYQRVPGANVMPLRSPNAVGRMGGR